MSVNSLAVQAAASQSPEKVSTPQNTAIASLTKYIPTESITLYVAAVSAQPGIESFAKWFTAGFAYWFFLGFTPVLLILVFLKQIKDSATTVTISKWPWWKMTAATIAFGVWAMAIPGNPVIPIDNPAGGVAAAFAALFVSTLLEMVGSLFEKKQGT